MIEGMKFPIDIIITAPSGLTEIVEVRNFAEYQNFFRLNGLRGYSVRRLDIHEPQGDIAPIGERAPEDLHPDVILEAIRNFPF